MQERDYTQYLIVHKGRSAIHRVGVFHTYAVWKKGVEEGEQVLNLKDILKGKVVLLCLGNIDRGDDGVGPFVASSIKNKVPYEVIDAGTTPENYTGVIKRLNPEIILIIDAIQFEGDPGEIRLFKGEDLRLGKISTHDVSPKLLIEYLKSSTNADIYILGIKPASNKFGEAMSGAVREAAKKIESLFVDNINGV